MQLRNFGSDDAPDRDAAAQMMIVIGALNQGRRHVVEQLLGADGEILAWYIPEEIVGNINPRHAVIKSGEGRIFVVVNGTTNAVQWTGHVAGSFAVPWVDVQGFGGARGATNYVWWWAGADLNIAISNAVAGMTVSTLFLSGHSYGGALAQVVARWRAAAPVGARVQCMTFGSPNVWTEGLGDRPDRMDVWVTIQSRGDPITNLPLGTRGIGKSKTSPPFQGKFPDGPLWFLDIPRWRPYGQIYVWEANGLADPNAPKPDPLPAWVNDSIWYAHSQSNYYGRATAPVRDSQGQYALDPFWQEVAFGEGVPLPTLPRYYDFGGRAWLVPFFSGNRSGLMPVPQPFTDGDLYTVSFLINGNGVGQSETYTIRYASGTSDVETPLRAWAAAYVTERVKALHSTYTIIGARVDRVGVQGGSLLFRGHVNFPDGEGKRTVVPAGTDDGLWVDLRDVSDQIVAPHCFGGWGAVDLGLVESADRTRVRGSTVLNAWITALKGLTTPSNPNFNLLAGGTVVIQSHGRTGGAATKYPVQEWAVSENGWFELAVPNAPGGEFSWNYGKKLTLKVPRNKWVRGVGGDVKIIGIDLVSEGGPWYTIDKKPCYPIATYDPVVGILMDRGQVTYPVAIVRSGYYGERRVGKLFGQVTGSRRRGC